MGNELLLKDNAQFDVVGIGSALLDFTVEVGDEMLDAIGVSKGNMHLIDESQSKEILEKLKGIAMAISPGGSSANTIAGIANFKGKAAFMGSVGKDEYGESYIIATEKTGIKARIEKYDIMTGHAITYITPDRERTFTTHLGAAIAFSEKDIAEEMITDSKIIHFEGYLFEIDNLRTACVRAMDIAKANNVKISIDLSDPALVNRIKGTFEEILPKYADIIFANEEEAMVYTGKDEAGSLDDLYELCSYAVVKLGARGSLIKYNDQVYVINPHEAEVVNTNGAGDMYASGVLYGISRGKGPVECGNYGSYAASLVVAQSAARLRDRIDIGKI